MGWKEGGYIERAFITESDLQTGRSMGLLPHIVFREPLNKPTSRMRRRFY